MQGNPEKTVVTKSGLKYQVLGGPTDGASPAPDDIAEFEFAVWTLKGEPRGGTYQLGKTIKAPIRGLAHAFFKEAMPLMKKAASGASTCRRTRPWSRSPTRPSGTSS